MKMVTDCGTNLRRDLLSAIVPLLVLQTIAEMAAIHVISPDCPDKCGHISIPYPFGIGHGCFRPGFEVTCKQVNISGEFKAFFGDSRSPHEVKDISVLRGIAHTLKNVSWNCYNSTGHREHEESFYFISEDLHMFKVSRRNRFTTIGCSTIGFIMGRNAGEHATTGCASFCFDTDTVERGSCSGTGSGCCQTTIPYGLKYATTNMMDLLPRSSDLLDYSPCTYAFLVDEECFQFNMSDVYHYNFRNRSKEGLPLALEWVAGNESCAEARKNTSSFACRSRNSVCVDSKHSDGYLCNCSAGYRGNPYLTAGGCTDIDECSELGNEYMCLGVCTNIAGGYNCSCPPGHSSDDPKTKKCVPNPEPAPGREFPLQDKLVIGNSVGAIFIFGCIFCIGLQHQKRKLQRDKAKFFRQNGGLSLYEEIRSKQVDTVKIYTKHDLEKATDNFNKNNELGRGGHGTVYKGRLDDGREVAIKRSKIIANDEGEQFVREMIILSHINHKNVVRLLGCCLEVEIPMLVYEFVPNKTLYDFIHCNNRKVNIPLDTRLRIARESAEALAYLHSWASPMILHGDVKSLNVLLDNQYVPKLSDFGASRMLSIDKVQFITMVQGTLGYLDPEFLLSRRLTTKSDVYSFGVVIVELITRKKAIYNDESGREKTLASDFLEAMKYDKLEEFLDAEIVGERGNAMDILREVAELAEECLNLKGDERPTMREVAERLHATERIPTAFLPLQDQTTLVIDQPTLEAEANWKMNSIY